MESSSTNLFSCVSNSARHLYLLLRSINFSQTAEVQISNLGIRFSVEQSRSVQGFTILEKTLFSSYDLHSETVLEDAASSEEASYIAPFRINLTALLEVLQIFGLSDVTARNASSNTGPYSRMAFNTPAMTATGGTCQISYPHVGASLSIVILEAGVTTTCELNTYQPLHSDTAFDFDDLIPFERDALTLKLIMRSIWLHDSISELSSTNPTTLVLHASNSSSPPFALEGDGGPFGNSSVDFRADSKSSGTSSVARQATLTPQVAEVYSVAPPRRLKGRLRQSYNFAHIQKAGRAMALASKVSIRVDRQGVLSLQFMIELEKSDEIGGRRGVAATTVSAAINSGKTTFVDFRFVPLIDDEADDPMEDSQDEAEHGSGSQEDDLLI